MTAGHKIRVKRGQKAKVNGTSERLECDEKNKARKCKSSEVRSVFIIYATRSPGAKLFDIFHSPDGLVEEKSRVPPTRVND